MTKKKAKDTLSNPPEFLAHLSTDDALAVLRLLARDETLAARIRQVTEAYLKGNAPHTLEDVGAIAGEVRRALESLEVEEVWERARRTRHGYVEPNYMRACLKFCEPPIRMCMSRGLAIGSGSWSV